MLWKVVAVWIALEAPYYANSKIRRLNNSREQAVEVICKNGK